MAQPFTVHLRPYWRARLYQWARGRDFQGLARWAAGGLFVGWGDVSHPLLPWLEEQRGQLKEAVRRLKRDFS